MNRKYLGILLIVAIGCTGIFLGSFWLGNQNDRSCQRMGVYKEIDPNLFVLQTVDHGRLWNYSGFLIMDLNGTYAEMGYAHGQLVGELIRYTISSIFYVLMGANLTCYEEFHDNLIANNVNQNQTYHSEEFQAIWQACVDQHYNMTVPELRRVWDVNDLWLMNAGYEVNRMNKTDFCSAWGVWGNNALDGKTMIGRDFDYYQDPMGLILQLELMIIYRGDGIRNTVASFNYPGAVGSHTGFNDLGVWISSDNTNGQWLNPKNSTLECIAQRNFLEQEKGPNVQADAIKYFTSIDAYAPFLFIIGSNFTTNENPVFVLEGNDNQVIARNAIQGQEYVYMTNSQRLLEQPTDGDERFDMYNASFANYTSTGDMKVSMIEGIQMNQNAARGWTLESFIFYPATLEFSIGLCQLPGIKDGQTWYKCDLFNGALNPTLHNLIQFSNLLNMIALN